MSESEGRRQHDGRTEEDRVIDAAVDEVERRARAQEDADTDERVAVRNEDGRITEERAQ